jgi:hypothetical protein
MKKIFLAFAIIGMTMFACTGKSAQSNEGTHTHEDGTTHEGHHSDSVAAPEQETFEVDTTHQHTHKHGDGHEHTH